VWKGAARFTATTEVEPCARRGGARSPTRAGPRSSTACCFALLRPVC
jgi:hypothetical protein